MLRPVVCHVVSSADTGDHGAGNIPPSQAGESSADDHPARPREEPLKVTVKRRLEQEGRWAEIEPVRDDMMRAARKERRMSKTDAQEWVYAELDRMYPPPGPSPGSLSGDGSGLVTPTFEHLPNRSREIPERGD